MVYLEEVISSLNKYASTERKVSNQRFFKTKPGEYGFGDKFLGITVPDTRKVAAKYKNISLKDLETLLHSPYHEVRLCALIIMVLHFKNGDLESKNNLFNSYIKNVDFINNWDLVDSSAGFIVGEYLSDKSKVLLKEYALSNHLWKKRIAMIATFPYIRKCENDTAFNIATILINDSHDLIQKAVGWMLREIGKNSGQEIEEKFLKIHYKSMPRTMLRYAIEKFSEEKRKKYLQGNI